MKEEFCGACQENPCMCSDPEQTSTVYDWQSLASANEVVKWLAIKKAIQPAISTGKNVYENKKKKDTEQ